MYFLIFKEAADGVKEAAQITRKNTSLNHVTAQTKDGRQIQIYCRKTLIP